MHVALFLNKCGALVLRFKTDKQNQNLVFATGTGTFYFEFGSNLERNCLSSAAQVNTKIEI